MSWTLAPSLVRLRDEVNRRWPNRSKASDGTIGDRAHAARTSEHNPDERGIVRAIDLDVNGIDPAVILDATIRDERVHYVIYDRRIYSRTHGWKNRKYTGSNPHTGHIHVSIRNNSSERASAAIRAHAARDTSSWGIAPTGPTPPKTGVAKPQPSTRTLKRGTVGDDVLKLQNEMLRVFPLYAKRIRANGGPNRNYGPATESVVKEFQRRHGKGLVVDGIVGPKTRAALASHGVRL